MVRRSRRLATEGEVEYMYTWIEDGVAHAAHSVRILRVQGDLIVADTVMCGALAGRVARRDGSG